MKKLNLILIGLMIISAARLSAGMFSEDNAGTTGGAFLKLGVGCRAIGMGEAYTGVSDEVSAAYWNPAGLVHIKEKQITAMHAVWLEKIFFDYAGYCQPVEKLNGTVGAAVTFLSAGELKKIDNEGNELDEKFTSYDMAMTLSYSRKMNEKLSSGVNLRYIRQKLEEETANGAGMDIGGLYKLSGENFSMGFMVQNIGTRLKFIDEGDPQPLNLKFGAGYKLLNNRLLIAVDVNFPIDNKVSAHIGSECRHKIKKDIEAAVRAGYKTTTIEDLDALSGLSAGAGVSYRGYGIDYAWVPYGDLGNTHRISLIAKF